jgi:hypothetical protein
VVKDQLQLCALPFGYQFHRPDHEDATKKFRGLHQGIDMYLLLVVIDHIVIF